MLPWHTTTIYGDPGTFGLRLITDVTIPEVPFPNYCDGGFDTVAIWKTTDGRYFIGNDRGCSCVKPFENTRADQLVEVRSKSDVADFLEDVWQTREIQDYFDGLTSGLDLA